jgi:hypothetical protein
VLGLLGLGLFLLPVMPTWAQEEPPAVRLRVSPDTPYEDVIKAAGDAQDLQRLRAEMEKKRAELIQLEAQLKAAQERLSKAPQAGEKVKTGRIILEIVDGDKRQVIELPQGSRVIGGDAAPAKGEAAAAEMKRAKEVLDKRLMELKAQGAAKDAVKRYVSEFKVETKEKPKGLVIEIISDGKRQVIELPPGSRVISGPEEQRRFEVRPAVPARPGQEVPKLPGTPAPPVVLPPRAEVPGGIIYRAGDGKMTDTDKRIADLEKRLEELMRAVKELHGDLQKGRAGPNIPIAPPAAKPFPGGQQGGAPSPYLPATPPPPPTEAPRQ